MAATDFLTEARIRRARPKERPYKLRDGGGLYLLITPTDAKQWRLRYAIGGRESMLSLGTYPATSLKAARAKRTEMRAAIEAGKDPATERRVERANSANSFETIAREWLGKQPFAPKTLQKAVWTFEDLLFPYIGSRPVSALTPPERLQAALYATDFAKLQGKLRKSPYKLDSYGRPGEWLVAVVRVASLP